MHGGFFSFWVWGVHVCAFFSLGLLYISLVSFSIDTDFGLNEIEIFITTDKDRTLIAYTEEGILFSSKVLSVSSLLV